MEEFGSISSFPGTASSSATTVPESPPRFSRGGVRLGFTTPPARPPAATASSRIAAMNPESSASTSSPSIDVTGRAATTSSATTNPQAATMLPSTGPTVSVANPLTPRRRSPRVAALQEGPPSEAQMRCWAAEDAFVRRVAARVAGSTSVTASSGGTAGGIRRTRAVTRLGRGEDVPARDSPHVPSGNDDLDGDGEETKAVNTDDGGDHPDGSSHDGVDDAGTGDDADYVDDDDGQKSVASTDRPCLAQVCKERVYVPPLQEVHASWAAWFEYLKVYSAETHQHHVVKETMSAKSRNARIALQGNAAASFSDALCPYMRVYICTHGWKDKQRGKGIRPMRFVRSTKCPLRYRVQWEEQGNQRHLKVTVTRLWHNHTINASAYGTLPVSRGIKDPAHIKRADDMVADGVRRAAVYDMLLANGENVFKVDVDNFFNSHQTRVGVADDNEATAKEIAVFSAGCDGSVVTVDETDRGETGVISLTTRHMRSMFSRFGELLLVDCTHKTNRYNYQLCTFMTMDEFGSGQCIQQSLFETNGDWHMHRALDHLKRANAESWKLVRVIVVDKDLNEIRVLQAQFPEAQILICHFHVLKYLSMIAHKPQYGKISSDDHKILEHVIHSMVYAQTRLAFDDARVGFLRLCDRLKFGVFADYMERNWFSCTEMWSLFERAKLPHFRNHTNNRLESWFGCFKEGVDENSSMSECVKALILEARRCQNEYEKRVNQNGSWRNETYDEEMGNVLLMSNPFVATAILPEYTCAFSKFESYVYEVDGDNKFAIVKGKQSDHVIDLLDWSCDCPFSKAMRLPCRHVMAYRKSKGRSSVIPLMRIDMRWKRETSVLGPVQRFKLNPPKKGPVPTPATVPPEGASRARYNEALRALQPIASELAEIDDPIDFHKYLEFISAQWRNVRQRKRGAACQPQAAERETSDPFSRGESTEAGGEASDVRGERTPPAEEHKEGDDEEHKEGDDADEYVDSQATPVELSQANSLYSDELGGVQVPMASLSQLSSVIPNPVSLHEFANGVGAGPAEQEPMDKTIHKDLASRSSMGESIRGGEKAVRGHNMATSGRDVDATVDGVGVHGRGEDATDGVIGAARDEESAPSNPRDEESAPSNPRPEIVINLNPKAAKSGRPRTDRQAALAEQRMDRARFNASEAIRRDTGELTLIDVLHALNMEKPSLDETRRRLAGVFTKFVRADSKSPCTSRSRRLRSTKTAIRVDTPPTRSRRRSPAPTPLLDGVVEVVSIANVGLFSREQIETMRQVEALKSKCDAGDQFRKWLRQQVASAVPAPMQIHARKIADEVAAMYPMAPVSGLNAFTEYKTAMLYRLQPPQWLNDAVIRAFCERLEQSHSFVRYAGTPTAKKGSGRAATGQRVEQDLCVRLASLAGEEGVTLMVLPVNFGNYHWAGIFVDTKAKTITYYDSMNQSQCLKPLDTLARNLCDGEHPTFPDYAVVSLNNPVQQDGHSCGLFVCYRLWRQADPTVPSDMSAYGMTSRRLEFLHFILYGSKLTQ